MRILLLTPRLPWPAIDGGRIAMSRLAMSLANAGAVVEILSLNPRKHRTETAGGYPLPLQVVDIDTSRLFAPLAASMRHGRPYLVERFVSAEFREALTSALARFQPDLVQIESPFLLPYADVVHANGNARIALRSLNVEFRIWESLARNETNVFRRLALKRVAASLRGYEVLQLNTADALIPISSSDRDDYLALGCTRPIHVSPCGVMRSPALSPAAGGPPSSEAAAAKSAAFIGSLDFRPNQQAVEWLISEMWPRVRRELPEARLAIGGSSPPDWLVARATGAEVDFHGHVPSSSAFLSAAQVVVAPLFAGGGMRIKVLEAMALGKPVVATPLGAGGIDVDDGRDILIAGDAQSFASAVVRLLREPETAQRIGAAAKTTIEARYDSDTIGRELLQFYETFAAEPRR
jgi:glycosyltransferase involved in cell wall biosynthesis